MPSFTWRRRVLPLTMAGMVFVLTQRTADLARTAMARDVATPAPTTVPRLPTVPTVPAAAPGPPATADVSDPSSPPAEYKLLEQLKRRREELDRREARLNAQSEVLAAAELRLRARLDELGALQNRLEALRTQQQQEDRDRWQDLVKVYAEMKPRDAAAIFDLLDPQTMTEVLDRMDDRKASGILAAMTPERARVATQLLVRRRGTAPGAGQGDGAAPHPSSG